MKPPRRKGKEPPGYSPFPIKLNKQRNKTDKEAENAVTKDKSVSKPARLRCEGVLTEDCHVRISAPGDMEVLYQMGFYGRGSLSKHEPVYHHVVEQNVEAIRKHLDHVSMERYSASQHTSVRSKAYHSQQVSPQSFIELYTSQGGTSNNDLSGQRKHYTEQFDQRTDVQTLCTVPKQPANHLTAPSEADMDTELTAFTETREAQVQSALPCSDYSFPEYEGHSAPNLPHHISKSEKCVDDWDGKAEDDDFWSSETLPETLVQPEVESDTISDELLSNYRPSEPRNVLIPDDSKFTLRYEGAMGAVQTIEPVQVTDDCADDVSDIVSSDDGYSYVHLSDLDIDDYGSAGEDKSEFYEMSEQLILDQYEAVFLKLGFNILQILDDSTRVKVTLEELWQRCIDNDKSFLPKYAVYHHFRAKGWVPKDGLTYGCDLMLYKRGPKYFHSSLGVVIRCCDGDNLEEIEQYNPRKLSWPKLMGINRVINNVRKELMICYVIIPKDLSKGTLYSPADCLRKISICETLFRRMVPSRERDQMKTSIIQSNVDQTAKKSITKL